MKKKLVLVLLFFSARFSYAAENSTMRARALSLSIPTSAKSLKRNSVGSPRADLQAESPDSVMSSESPADHAAYQNTILPGLHNRLYGMSPLLQKSIKTVLETQPSKNDTALIQSIRSVIDKAQVIKRELECFGATDEYFQEKTAGLLNISAENNKRRDELLKYYQENLKPLVDRLRGLQRKLEWAYEASKLGKCL
jgi:hypothetical protein